MTPVSTNRIHDAFRALRHRNFRFFWVGQWVSVTGTWMQTMAQAWLIYRLTDSPMVLGVLGFARFGPALIGSPFAGVVADRLPRRKVVITTQVLSLLQAALLAVLTLTGHVRVWQVLVLALFQGCVDVLDMTVRQTFQMDLVGAEDLPSAVSLNSMAFNAGRLVGPGIAGLLVAAFGEGICFAINAASYLAVLTGLLMIRVEHVTPGQSHSIIHEIAEGIRFAWNHVEVRGVLTILCVFSVLGISIYTLLPVFARDRLHAGARGYGFLLASAGVGAILGAFLAVANKSTRHARRLNAVGLLVFALGISGLALSRNVFISNGVMLLMGANVAAQLATTNSFLQITAPLALRGRIISIYVWIFGGLPPVGGLLLGTAAEHLGVVTAALGSATLCLLAGLYFIRDSGGEKRTG